MKPLLIIILLFISKPITHAEADHWTEYEKIILEINPEYQTMTVDQQAELRLVYRRSYDKRVKYYLR
jgi:hypothetical protein